MIGAGPRADRYAATIQRLPQLELAAVVSTQPRKREFGARHCLSSVYALERSMADGVIIASAAASHASLARHLLEHGWPVLCEKPLALRAPGLHGAVRVVGTGMRANALLMVAITDLYGAPFAALQARLAKRGTIVRIESAGGNRGPFRSDCNALWDYGPHDLAMCLHLLRAPLSLSECRVERHHGGQNTTIGLSRAGIPVADIRVGNGFACKSRWLRVMTADTEFLLDDLAVDKLVAGRRGERLWPVHYDRTFLPLDRQLMAFRLAVRRGQGRHWSAALALRVHRLLASCERQSTR